MFLSTATSGSLSVSQARNFLHAEENRGVSPLLSSFSFFLSTRVTFPRCAPLCARTYISFPLEQRSPPSRRSFSHRGCVSRARVTCINAAQPSSLIFAPQAVNWCGIISRRDASNVSKSPIDERFALSSFVRERALISRCLPSQAAMILHC